MANNKRDEMLPSSQKAIIQAASPPGTLQLCLDRPVPNPSSRQVLVKIAAVALNPCDWKMPARVPCPGASDGSDFSGAVVQVGEHVTAWKIGDRVAGAMHGSNPIDMSSGAFTEYIVTDTDLLWKVPDFVSWEEAAAVGWAVVGSVLIALFRALNLSGSPEEPTQKPEYVLLYGGSTASGTLATQLLKLSGYKIVTTCSPANFELLESLGAEKCFDYNSPTCGQEIRAYTKNSLQYAFDIITEAKSIAHCYAAIGRGGGKYVGFDVLPTKLIESLRKTVKAGWVLGLEMSGKQIALPGEYYREPNPALLQWGVDWFPRIGNLIAARKLKSHPVRVMEGGLDAVIDGLGDMREKRVSGQKMVYLVQPRDQYSLLQDTVSSNGSKSHHSSDRSSGHASSDRSSESSYHSSVGKGEVIPAKQQTLVIKGPSHIILEVDRPVPKVGNHEVLIKVLYVSLNQYDAKSSDLSPVIGATPGCCFAGEVASLGSGTTENRFSIGDKVCATVFGNNPDNLNGGAFAQFVAVDADFVLKIPSGMSLQVASTFPLGLATLGLALYHHMNLALPVPNPTSARTKDDSFVLVYGGSTATGRLAIQLVRMSGMTPITTCSPHNFALMRSLGAAEVFDYNTTTCASNIRTYTNNSVKFVLDCICDTRSIGICRNTLSPTGGKIVGLEYYNPKAIPRMNKNIETSWIILWTIFGKKVSWKKPYQRDAQPNDYEFGKRWFKVVHKLLDENTFKNPEFEEKEGGLRGVIQGIDFLRKGKSTGVKLVYRI